MGGDSLTFGVDAEAVAALSDVTANSPVAKAPAQCRGLLRRLLERTFSSVLQIIGAPLAVFSPHLRSSVYEPAARSEPALPPWASYVYMHARYGGKLNERWTVCLHGLYKK